MADRLTVSDARNMLNECPRLHSRWTHHSGVVVTVLGCSMDADTLRPRVHYEHDGIEWSRPLLEWTANVGSGPRFTEVRE